MRQKETEQELARTGTGARQENFMFWARLRCRFGGDQRRDTGRQPTATPKMAFGTGSGVTLKSVTGSTGLQNEGLNMLRATWNPLKQCRLPMRLLCVPYFQETSGTHRFCGPGDIRSMVRDRHAELGKGQTKPSGHVLGKNLECGSYETGAWRTSRKPFDLIWRKQAIHP